MSAVSPRQDGPVFIGGVGRSGTTLVVDILGLHPRLSPVYETDFVCYLLDLTSNRWVPRTLTAFAAGRHMDGWTRPLPHRPQAKRSYESYYHGAHHVLFDRTFALARTAELQQAVRAGRAREGVRAVVEVLFAEHARLDGKPRWINKTPGYVQRLAKLHRVFPGPSGTLPESGRAPGGFPDRWVEARAAAGGPAGHRGPGRRPASALRVSR